VVDDDEAIRTVASEVLDDEPSLRTAQARDGAEVLDLAMPVLDGFEVCRRLKPDPETRAIPVVVMSAGERRQSALDAGADDFIAKPFGIVQLAQTVHRWLASGAA
jgi:two-component system phosphate regulon response regulator PhoB